MQANFLGQWLQISGCEAEDISRSSWAWWLSLQACSILIMVLQETAFFELSAKWSNPHDKNFESYAWDHKFQAAWQSSRCPLHAFAIDEGFDHSNWKTLNGLATKLFNIGKISVQPTVQFTENHEGTARVTEPYNFSFQFWDVSRRIPDPRIQLGWSGTWTGSSDKERGVEEIKPSTVEPLYASTCSPSLPSRYWAKKWWT